MKQFRFTILTLCTLALCVSCDKLDCNGDLDGNWQLTSWENKTDGSIAATNKDGIYYTVKLELIKISRTGEPQYYLSRFRQTKDSLILTEVHVSPFDSLAAPKDMKVFGVSEDGRFHIDKLDAKKMVLSNSIGILSFRKY